MLTAKGRKARKAAEEFEAKKAKKERKKKQKKKRKRRGPTKASNKQARTINGSGEASAAAAGAVAEAVYVADGQIRGNVGRFFLINHSAKPNLFLQCVFTGTCAGHHGKYDERMPTLALFASRDIPARTELTFDYGKLHAETHKLHENIAAKK